VNCGFLIDELLLMALEALGMLARGHQSVNDAGVAEDGMRDLRIFSGSEGV
jgi:hypothetical protein